MSRLPLLLSLALMASSPTFAAEGKCDCSKSCMTQCKKGNGKDCKCSHCDCKTTGKCTGNDKCEKSEAHEGH